jgi:phospholysine phosphohistidine inorganic pyrophosphate phosphatase
MRFVRVGLSERVGGFLIDLDGTVIEAGALIPGAAEALRVLIQKEIPFRIVTNTTSKPRSAILAKLRALGALPSSRWLGTAISAGWMASVWM